MEIPSLLKPRLHGMMHYTCTIPLEMVQIGSQTPLRMVSCGSDVRFEVFQGGDSEVRSYPPFWRGGGTHESVVPIKGHYLGIGYGIHH